MAGVIDLNADIGEGMGDDLALLELVTSASIATGAHAGGGQVLLDSAEAAVAHGVAVGAHPSYRDRAGFGRRSLLALVTDDLTARKEFSADLRTQIMDVAMATARYGGALHHVKPHGALYNEAVVDDVAASVIASAVADAGTALGHSLAVFTQPGGRLAEAAERAGLQVVAEGFVDRAYDPSGRLLARGLPGAVLADADAMVGQALALAGGSVRCSDGSMVDMPVRSLCVHGDTPGAVVAAMKVRAALIEGGWGLAAPQPEGPQG